MKGKALTIDAYWAWAIVHGAKRIENRNFYRQYRGPVWIHAGRNRSRDEDAHEKLGLMTGRQAIPTPEQADAIRGKIIGLIDLVGCHRLDHGNRSPLCPRCDCYDLGPCCAGGALCNYCDAEVDTPPPTIWDDPFVDANYRYQWELANVRALDDPIPAIGQQGLWTLTEKSLGRSR